MYKGIIFDLDGVITDTAKYHFEAWRELAESRGFHFTREDNERLKGVSRMKSLEIILEINGALDRYTEAEKESLCTEKNDRYVELIGRLTHADILPGIADLMAEIKAKGMKTAVASVSKNAPAVLAALGIADDFDYIADAKKVTKSKPDPEIFLVCADALGLDPAECIGIEDAQAGIEAIKAAGMRSVGINVAVTTVEPDIALKSTAELSLDKITA